MLLLKKLKKIWLNNNNISEKGMEYISKCEFLQNLNELNLHDNKMNHGIKEKYIQSNKTNFPKLFENNIVTKENLSLRAGNDELERIVQKIVQLL